MKKDGSVCLMNHQLDFKFHRFKDTLPEEQISCIIFQKVGQGDVRCFEGLVVHQSETSQ